MLYPVRRNLLLYSSLLNDSFKLHYPGVISTYGVLLFPDYCLGWGSIAWPVIRLYHDQDINVKQVAKTDAYTLGGDILVGRV